MAEKVKLKSATKLEGQNFCKVAMEDGRVGSSFDLKLLEMIGQEFEVEVKEGKVFQGVQQYYFTLPKEKKAGAFPVKDYAFAKRDSSLNHAINSIKVTGKEVSSDNILALAGKYYDYLNQK